MDLANKIFKNNKTGETIKVIDSFENIVILENKQKLDINSLMDTNQYTEQIDPNNFFNNQGAYNILAEKIKNIPTHMMQDDEDSSVISVNPPHHTDNEFKPMTNESAILMTTEDDERAELARKYGYIDNKNNTQRQNEAFSKILGEDSENELPQVNPFKISEEENVVQRVEVNREITNTQTTQRVEVEDPIITMFKKTKRNVEFKINVEISDKIPRLDFIEMMEDSYETSMIDFLADEFTNKILQDPTLIRESIKNKIKQLVYGATSLSSNNKTTDKEEKNSKDISSINDQITDAVTQFKEDVSFNEKTGEVKTEKPKTTKPRTKKESTEK